MSATLCKPPFFLYYVYKCRGTSTDNFSVKEATFNLKLAECMQKTCGDLNPQLHKNRSYALICDFYWRLSQLRSKLALVLFYFNARVANTCSYNCKFLVLHDVVTLLEMAVDNHDLRLLLVHR